MTVCACRAVAWGECKRRGCKWARRIRPCIVALRRAHKPEFCHPPLCLRARAPRNRPGRGVRCTGMAMHVLGHALTTLGEWTSSGGRKLRERIENADVPATDGAVGTERQAPGACGRGRPGGQRAPCASRHLAPNRASGLHGVEPSLTTRNAFSPRRAQCEWRRFVPEQFRLSADHRVVRRRGVLPRSGCAAPRRVHRE